MSGDHSHARSNDHTTAMAVSFGLVIVLMVAEGVGGWLTGSLALISDAGHMATDALGLGMALAAARASRDTGTSRGRTYGLYRAEILAALANAVLLFGVAGYVIWEAIGRLESTPEVLTGPMALVALAGLVVNVITWRLLRQGAEESLNVEGAFLEVVADLIGSIGVLLAALIIWLTGWTIVDPIVGAAIGLFILPRAWRLGRKAIRILIQAAPHDVDLDVLSTQLRTVPEVVDVHDLHVWTLTSGMDVATAHLMTRNDADAHTVLDRARTILTEVGIDHATLQIEPESHEGCTTVDW